MKKLLSSLILFLSLFLVACDNDNDVADVVDTPDKVAGQVQLVVNLDTNKVDEKVNFEAGDTVMDVLDDNYEVEEDNGMITAIDGLAQDEAKGVYWMFKVNGEMSSTGAEQTPVKEGDKIEFYQEAFQ